MNADRSKPPRFVRSALQSSYAYAGAAALWSILYMLEHTCRVRTHGPQPPAGRSIILCFWHRNLLPCIPLIRRDPRRWVSFFHPAHHLAPWIAVARAARCEIIAGSSGHGGRHAADEIEMRLRAGFSTFVCPDGPSGPPNQLRKGVLHLAHQSGAPVVPVRVACDHAIVIPSWDRKYIPLPSSTIDFTYSEPVVVTGDNFQESLHRIERALG